MPRMLPLLRWNPKLLESVANIYYVHYSTVQHILLLYLIRIMVLRQLVCFFLIVTGHYSAKSQNDTSLNR
jgi:hypothetical protein